MLLAVIAFCDFGAGNKPSSLALDLSQLVRAGCARAEPQYFDAVELVSTLYDGRLRVRSQHLIDRIA